MTSAPSTVADALAQARRDGVDRLDAQLLIAHVLSCSRAWVLAHDDAPLPPEALRRMLELMAARADAVPLAYLLGEKEFHGLTLGVGPGVLVPRPETEVLVDWALERLAQSSQPCPAVVDLGTGSGAIALALASAHREQRRPMRICATDLSDAALRRAAANARRLQADVEWLAGNWWEPLTGRRFDLAVSNPPYVADGDNHLHALRHEPELALRSGVDGLDALRIIIGGAPAHLEPGAWLLLEHGHDQAHAVRELLVRQGFSGVESRRDFAGVERCTGGHR